MQRGTTERDVSTTRIDGDGGRMLSATRQEMGGGEMIQRSRLEEVEEEAKEMEGRGHRHHPGEEETSLVVITDRWVSLMVTPLVPLSLTFYVSALAKRFEKLSRPPLPPIPVF